MKRRWTREGKTLSIYDMDVRSTLGGSKASLLV